MKHKSIHKEIQDIDIDDIEEKPTKLKKVIIFIMGLFMILLFLSYFLIGPHTLNIIESMFISSKMDQFVVSGDDFEVVFDALAYSQLREIYFENQRYEIKFCLGGDIVEDTYFVKEILLPKQKGSYAQVVYTPCPAETIVSMHSHPYRRCRASEQDFKSFDNFRKTSPDAIMMVMCEEDRFFVFR
ncbi:hypothetical protein ACFL96_08455 [Thermoproteota archaeon]